MERKAELVVFYFARHCLSLDCLSFASLLYWILHRITSLSRSSRRSSHSSDFARGRTLSIINSLAPLS